MWASRRVQLLRLERLGKRACERLITLALGPSVTPKMTARIIERSTGNALYLEELIRAAASEKGEEAPPTVLAMLQARFLRMDPTPRRVLRLASIFGQEFWRGGLLALLGPASGEHELDAALHALIDAELIERSRESRFGEDTQYSVRHALSRDAAYAMLTEQDRRDGHCQVGNYLEAIGERNPVLLAEHFQLGGALERAAAYCTRAADLAIAGNDLKGALALTGRGLSCRPQGPMRGALLACETLAHLWSADLVDRCGTEALGLLGAGSRRWCTSMGAMFAVVIQLQQLSRFEPLTLAFSAVEPSEEARTAYLEAASMLVLVFASVGARAPARGFLARMEVICADASVAEASSYGWLQYSKAFYTYLLEPEPWAALVAAKRAVAWFEAGGDRRMTASACSPLGFLEAELTGLAAAEATLRAGLALLEGSEATLIFGYLAMNLALLLADEGPPERLAEASALARSVLERVGRTTIYSGTARCALALVEARQDDFTAAEEHAREGREILSPTPGMVAPGFIALIEVLLRQGRTAEARAVAEQGMATVQAIGGGGSFEMRLRLAVIEAWHAGGAFDAARQGIEEAMTQLRARAASIPDEAARAYFLAGAPTNVRLAELSRRWAVDLPIYPPSRAVSADMRTHALFVCARARARTADAEPEVPAVIEQKRLAPSRRTTLAWWVQSIIGAALAGRLSTGGPSHESPT